jgi:serine protease DegQ
MRKLWLLFSQTVTVLVAGYFVVATLKPHWLSSQESWVTHPSPPVSAAPNLRNAAQAASPAVVSINTHSAPASVSSDPWLNFFFGQSPQSQEQNGLGSGVIIDSARGVVLTNNHVIEGADQMVVTLTDGRRANARVLGSDPETDLAVLQIRLPKLPAITLGNSNTLAVGDTVLAIGNPFGVGQTVTAGIVSALGRSELGINTFENFIQTDAAINPGNSGGALVDIAGQLVGINTAIYSQSGGSMGIGFAIPTSLALQVAKDILAHGSVTRGWIGIEPQALNAELAQALGVSDEVGVVIAGVLQGSPGEKAGLLPGDVVSAINGQSVPGVAALLAAVAQLTPGQPAQLSVRRHGNTLEITITPSQRPTPAQRLQR